MPDTIYGTSEELLFKPLFTNDKDQHFYLLELPSEFINFPVGTFLNINSDKQHPKFEKYTKGFGGLNVKCVAHLGKKNGNPMFVVMHSDYFGY